MYVLVGVCTGSAWEEETRTCEAGGVGGCPAELSRALAQEGGGLWRGVASASHGPFLALGCCGPASTLLAKQPRKFPACSAPPELPYRPGQARRAAGGFLGGCGAGEVLACGPAGWRGAVPQQPAPYIIASRDCGCPWEAARGRAEGHKRLGVSLGCFSPYYISASSCVCQLSHPLAY